MPRAAPGGLEIEVAVDGHNEAPVRGERRVADAAQRRVGGWLLEREQEERDVHRPIRFG